MLEPWLELPGVSGELVRLTKLAGFDLIEAGTHWDAERLRDTRIAQPLIFASSLVSAQTVLTAGVQPQIVSGHSIGEWSAAVLAGVLSADDAMRLVVVRATAMARACQRSPSAMAAVLGGERVEVLDRLQELGLQLANDNGAGQLVAGGNVEAIEQLCTAPPARARVRKLDVAGAFHTTRMTSAVAEVRDAAAGLAVKDAAIPVISNLDGAMRTDGTEILRRMIGQISRPVRWDLCMATLGHLRVRQAIEVSPAGTLSGLVRRALPDVTTVRIDQPSDLTALPAAPELSGARQ